MDDIQAIEQPISLFETSVAVESPHKRKGRSRLSNRSQLPPPRLGGVDGRNTWARRRRDVINEYTADLGGDDRVTAAERHLICICGTIVTELEMMALRFALGKGDIELFDAFQRGSNTLRRHFETLGLERRQKNITRDIDAYLTTEPAEGQP